MKSSLASEGGTPVRKEFLPFSLPMLGDEEKAEVLKVLDSGWITTGPRAFEFEKKVAAYVGASEAVALSSCTAALHVSLAVLGVGPGDEVITSTLTFCSTANVIIHLGAKPVLVDVRSDTLGMDPVEVEKKMTAKTKAIIPVHYAGHPCRMDDIDSLAASRSVPVVEDAAHALGAEYRGKKIGSLSRLTCFSFYPIKNITTAEGGAITLNDRELADKIRLYSLHGMSKDAWKRYSSRGAWYYEVLYPGFKYNLTDLQAALGLHQMDRLDGFLARREHIASLYDEAFSECEEVSSLHVERDVKHARHLYPILLNLEKLSIDRGRFIDELRAENIGTTVNFVPVHMHPYYRDTFGYGPGDFPVAEDAYERVISIPLYPRMTDEDANDVMEAVKKVASHHRKG
ncbi:MAG: DegT/DnrJ/EryC1/StrS aminotransferase family protein [Candidatus Eiseniibacteriota bacterium]|nr:MAG: DegT/DnrJ/EryC1/StrS aminotransferase family protein [Candidatus Eisenbacteria bacterium]